MMVNPVPCGHIGMDPKEGSAEVVLRQLKSGVRLSASAWPSKHCNEGVDSGMQLRAALPETPVAAFRGVWEHVLAAAWNPRM